VRIRQALSAFVLCIPLAGCGTINAWIAHTTAQHVPVWAGGLPEDAPPRPGTPEYAEYRARLEGNAPNLAPRQNPGIESVASNAIY
jgi:hypothetical protein